LPAGRVVAGSGSFLLQIAYDETWRPCRAGYLLEIETIEAGLPDPVRWTDSCTAPGNTMYRRLWSDTRTIEAMSLSLGSFGGDVAVTAVPLLRAVKAEAGASIRLARSEAGSNSHGSPDVASRSSGNPVDALQRGVPRWTPETDQMKWRLRPQRAVETVVQNPSVKVG